MHRTTEAEIRLRVRPPFPDTCLDWSGPILNGRAILRIGRSTASAPKLVYELFVGPVPESWVVRQTCGNLRCVNPQHLICVSRRDVQCLIQK